MATAPKTINQLARDIIKGDLKIADVPAFRRKPVENLMRIVKPAAIEIMAAKDEGKSFEPKRDEKKEPSRFMAGEARVRNVRSW